VSLVADFDGSFTASYIWHDLQEKVFKKTVEFEDLFNEETEHWRYLDFLNHITSYC